MEALGFEVALLENRRCCGRPAFSQGNLDFAAELGRHNIDLLVRDEAQSPIIFLEPSCWSMFMEDYMELGLADAESVRRRCFLFETFVSDLLARAPQTLSVPERSQSVVIHAHCHSKSIIKTAFMARLAEQLPGRRATLLETGCCGMAGAFGMLEEKRDLSLKIAQPLVEKIASAAPGSAIIASGTSCRHQIADLTGAHPRHMAELFADALP